MGIWPDSLLPVWESGPQKSIYLVGIFNTWHEIRTLYYENPHKYHMSEHVMRSHDKITIRARTEVQSKKTHQFQTSKH